MIRIMLRKFCIFVIILKNYKLTGSHLRGVPWEAWTPRRCKQIRQREYRITLKIIITAVLLLLLPVYALAETLTFSGYAETGARATDESEYELELNDNYVYHNYHAKVAQSFSERFGYDIGAFLYQKDYEELNSLNNESRVFNAGIFYWLCPPTNSAGSVKFDLDMKVRRKRYEDNLAGDYDQVMIVPAITWKMADKSSVALSAGLNNYNYLNRENETKRFIRVRGTKYLSEDRLMLSGGVRVERLDERQQNRYRTQNKADAGLRYKADTPWLESVSLKAEAGRGDTKDEDNDLDLDYRYWQGSARTWHIIGGKIKTDLAYEYRKKDYLLANNDFRQFSISNGWNYEWLSLDLKHKEVAYGDRVNSNYRRETLGVGARYAKRMDWNARAGMEGNYYRYENGVNDKNRYNVILGGEKVLTKQGRLGVELKWRITNNSNSADKRDAGVRVTGEWKY